MILNYINLQFHIFILLSCPMRGEMLLLLIHCIITIHEWFVIYNAKQFWVKNYMKQYKLFCILIYKDVCLYTHLI